MAINFLGTLLTGNAASEASESNYTPPSVVPVETDIVFQTFVNIDKATVDESDAGSTWNAIYTELDVSGAAFSSFFDATNTVTAYLECSNVDLIDEPKYKNNLPYYSCNVKLRAKVVV